MDANVYGKGTPIVLVHGLLGLFTSWTRLIPCLAGHAEIWEVRLPDYKDQPEGYDLGDYVRYLLDLLETHHLTDVTLVGNSLGGHIATRIAARYPDRIARVVLITSSGLFDETTAHEKLIVRTPSKKNVDQVVRHVFHNQGFCEARTVEEIIDYYLSDRRIRMRSFIRTARKLRTEDATNDCRQIRIPTLIVWGANDRVVPVQIAHRFHALIPDSRLEILDRCGHAPQIEHAEPVSLLIREFSHDMQGSVARCPC
jgi:pimeloyl-ACP methyl ester carboxylesterase